MSTSTLDRVRTVTSSRLAKRAVIAAAVVGVSTFLIAGPAGAQDATATSDFDISTLPAMFQKSNMLWIVIGAALVMFMQAGFAALETGFVRAKNGSHTMAMNIAVFGTGATGFFLVGYALMFGGYSANVPGFDWGYDKAVGSNLIGSGHWVFLWKGGWALTGVPTASLGAVAAFFLYMLAFMDTAATIPTGSMAERWKFKSFVIWGFFCGAIYYPLFGAWTWGGGWLSQLGNTWKLGNGYVDFAGSGVVHAVGGVAALTGAIVLGPRIGKYGKDGKARGLPGHNIPMAGIGTLILFFGWFGFNAASTLQIADGQFGLVAITAPCAFVSPWAAAVIGVIAGVIVVEVVFFVDQKLKIDDPVGAIGVHFANGIWGVIALGLFANGTYGADALGAGLGWNGTTTHVVDGAATGVYGLFYGHTGAGQLGAQVIGALVIIFVMGGISYGFFKLCNALTKGGIRSNAEDEVAGLDLPEMGVLAYPDFAGTHESLGSELEEV